MFTCIYIYIYIICVVRFSLRFCLYQTCSVMKLYSVHTSGGVDQSGDSFSTHMYCIVLYCIIVCGTITCDEAILQDSILILWSLKLSVD